jgi:hypothetical protein
MEARRRRDLTMVLVVGAGAVYSWVAAGFRPFTTPEEVLVAVPAVAALVTAAWMSGSGPPDTPRGARR